MRKDHGLSEGLSLVFTWKTKENVKSTKSDIAQFEAETMCLFISSHIQ
jgi:hypothetical protein